MINHATILAVALCLASCTMEGVYQRAALGAMSPIPAAPAQPVPAPNSDAALVHALETLQPHNPTN